MWGRVRQLVSNLLGDTRDYQGLLEGLPGATRGYQGLPEATRGYHRLPQITKDYQSLPGLPGDARDYQLY